MHIYKCRVAKNIKDYYEQQVNAGNNQAYRECARKCCVKNAWDVSHLSGTHEGLLQQSL